MERVVYCPSPDFINEAEQEARRTLLPIVVGDSERLKNLSFDRGRVCVVEIPKHQWRGIFSETVPAGMHQFVYIVDEFCGNEFLQYKVFINDEIVQPMYSEKHTAKWSVPCNTPGQYSIRIVFGNETVLESAYNVCSKV